MQKTPVDHIMLGALAAGPGPARQCVGSKAVVALLAAALMEPLRSIRAALFVGGMALAMLSPQLARESYAQQEDPACSAQCWNEYLQCRQWDSEAWCSYDYQQCRKGCRVPEPPEDPRIPVIDFGEVHVGDSPIQP